MKQYIETTSRYRAQKIAPWASVITKCEGGYWAFEFISDWQTWRGQK